jgi:Fic family protein
MRLSGKDSFKYDDDAAEVVGNIHAMEQAIGAAQGQNNISVSTILDIHKMLCEGTRIEKIGGAIRTEQNWIGGNSYNPLNADYIPPAPQYVPQLLEDLAAFCNDTLMSPVVQAALTHAQFETIHPFADGNGRTGRALIHLILRKRGLTPSLVPPISLIMATHSKSYTQGLTEFRFLNSDDEVSIQNGLNDWISFFAGACLRACEEAQLFEKSASRLQESWRKKLGFVRKNSALDLLLGEMVGIPMFTIASVSVAIGRAISAVTPAIARCVEVGIVKPMGNQKRNRTFEATEVIKEFNIFERRLASPVGNTEIAKPARKVPDKLI